MSRIRVTLSPGIIRDPDTVLRVRFQAPRTAENVRIVLTEMDTWQYRRDTHVEWSDAANDPVATFTGTIARRKFQCDNVQQAEAPRNAPIIKLRFHGNDKVHEVRVPDATLAEEGCELELGLQVQADITRRRRVVNVEYMSRLPVFVRNIGPEGDSERPVITFITGRDRFNRAGRQFWRRRADGVISRSSVQSILRYLGRQRNLNRYGDGHWGDINIVSHANSYQWMVRPFIRRRRLPGMIDTNVLNVYGEDDRLTAPGDDMIDAETKVIIRGCAIGNNQRLLNQIQTLMGGNAHVYAPKYLQYYQWHQRGRLRTQREFFLEYFYFYKAGSRSPRRVACREKLVERYPNAGIDEAEWNRLLRGTGRRVRKDRTERFNYRHSCGAERPPRRRAELLDILRANWPNDHTVYDTAVDDWKWRPVRVARGRRNNRQYWVIFRGRRRRIEVRRPLKDADGNLVVPNLYEQSHYGRSPAWGWE